ncbi:MAG: DNA cytosine methyltransferase [bacterium]
MHKRIPVIDLFAGPGGLGEGFSSILDDNGKRVFDIKLSVEKDNNAYETLLLRSFIRQFPLGKIPPEYYDYVKQNDHDKQLEKLKRLKNQYPEKWEHAQDEAWHFELPHDEGYTNKEIIEKHKLIDQRIKKLLNNTKEWVLIGGPPCQAYSIVGRSRNRGIREDDHRVQLYKEYLRIIAQFQPAIFVMENVKGLLSARVNNQYIFPEILRDLKDPGSVFNEFNSKKYKIYSFVKEPVLDAEDGPVYKSNKDYLIEAEKYGIPQKRHRVILLGVREDINATPTTLKQKESVYLDSIIGSLPRIRSGISRRLDTNTMNGRNKYLPVEDNPEKWRDVLNKYLKKLQQENSFKSINGLKFNYTSLGKNFISTEIDEVKTPELLKDWYKDPNLDGVLNHESRKHLQEDLGRYLFSSLTLKETNDFPRLKDYPDWLKPKHRNHKSGNFVDRFRTQKPHEPASTITSHISKDGHYFIHYDPAQCRSLTVREAARIQTFPDNYYFCGSRTAQFHQVGNAVPPYLAKQLAEVVLKIFKL